MAKYSVKQVSEMAGVTIKTLHHYDKIGLLSPSHRSDKNYRYYGKEELYKLQQIMFYRELDFSLQDIKSIMNDPDFDVLSALISHKDALLKKANRFKVLLETLEKTIVELKSEEEMMTNEELYKGFSKELAEDYRNEAIERWGEEKIQEVEERLKSLGTEGWEDVQKKGEEINQMLADLMDLDASAPQVQETVSLHLKHLNTFYEVSKERYLGLGKMYTEDARFTAHYDKYHPGLANFLYEAIQVYCANWK